MTHKIHDISVAKQIGKYSDAVAVGSNVRWLMTSARRAFRLPATCRTTSRASRGWPGRMS